MGRSVEVPRYNVLSSRFSDEENTAFRDLAKDMGIPISQLVRRAMLEWKEGRCAAKNAAG